MAKEKTAKTIFRYPYQATVAYVPDGGDRQWAQGDWVLVLGEISNMPGHVAVVTLDGKVHWGYHPDEFEAAEEEG